MNWHTLLTLWPFLKIFAVFGLILVGMRLKAGIAGSIALGSVALALFFRIPIEIFLQSVLGAFVDINLMLILAVVALIMVLSDLLEKTGQSERLMANMAGFLPSRRLKLVFFPALIGLLPMPGGAVFSAPLMNSTPDGMSLRPEDKVFLNYWFRHVWELFWPLYPGLIMAAYLAKVPVFHLVALSWPSVAATLSLGWLFFLRPGVLPLPDHGQHESSSPRNGFKALIEGLPLVAAIGGSIIFEFLIWLFKWPFPGEAGLVLALVLAIVIGAFQGSLSPVRLFHMAVNKHIIRMIVLVLAIFVFKAVLEGGGVVREITAVGGGQTALILASTVPPFIVGLISGITMAYVGSTFPLILALAQTSAAPGTELAYIVLGLFSGFTGVLVSPLHVCLVLTCEYYHVTISSSWRRLILPCSLFLLFGTLYFLVLRSILGQ